MSGQRGADGRRDAGDAVGEVDDDPVERRVLPGAGGIRDRPVEPAQVCVRWGGFRGEFLVSGVAYGDHEVGRAIGAAAVVENVVDVPRRDRGQGDAVSACCGDGAGVHAGGGVGAGRRRGDRTGVVPQRGGELGARRVVGADEHDPHRVVHLDWLQSVEGAGGECQVGTAPVRLRAVPGQNTDLLKRANVVREKVRRHVEQLLQLRG